MYRHIAPRTCSMQQLPSPLSPGRHAELLPSAKSHTIFPQCPHRPQQPQIYAIARGLTLPDREATLPFFALTDADTTLPSLSLAWMVAFLLPSSVRPPHISIPVNYCSTPPSKSQFYLLLKPGGESARRKTCRPCSTPQCPAQLPPLPPRRPPPPCTPHATPCLGGPCPSPAARCDT